jgi:ectoine hydroxylase
MKLTARQIASYRKNGYLFVPNIFPPREIAVVKREVEKLVKEDRPSVIYEHDKKTVRSVLNAHTYSKVLDRFCKSERVINPVMQLVKSPVYIFQSIVNVKRAFDGVQWTWHQDYPTYKIDDLMPTTRAVNCMIFVDEVTEFNGPLMIVPGTQKYKVKIGAVDTSVTPYPHGRYPDVDWIKPLMAGRGIVAPKGKPGSIIFMDLLTVHGSGPNMSPWHRSVMSLTLNSVENKATGTVRGPSICHDYAPIQPFAAKELIAAARA